MGWSRAGQIKGNYGLDINFKFFIFGCFGRNPENIERRPQKSPPDNLHYFM
jgi:hypothetical protein